MYKLRIVITGTQSEILNSLQIVSYKVRNPRPPITRGEARAIKTAVKVARNDGDNDELKTLMNMHKLYFAYCDGCSANNAVIITTSKGAQCCQCNHAHPLDLTQDFPGKMINGNISQVTE